jgi:hypothetical protein
VAGTGLMLPRVSHGQRRPLEFKTHAGHVIKVSGGTISYDREALLQLKYPEDIIDTGKLNRIIEDHGAVFLFLAERGEPNLDRYNVYKISPSAATMVADAILSSVKDYDHDGYLEFGGRDLTEHYPNPDSMYYIPTEYYEIRNGEIQIDKTLTIQKDKEINGVYLPPGKRHDKDGFCCVVIPAPRHKGKKTVIINSPYLEKSYLPSDTTTVSATAYVLSGQDAITEAVHNANGSWEFFSDNRTYTPETALRKVKLGLLVKLDPTVLDLCWVPKGWFATRKSKDAPWGWDKLRPKD